MNDMFLRKTPLSEVLFKVPIEQEKKHQNGELFIGLASTDPVEISKIINRNETEMLNDLYALISLVKNEVPKDPWRLDYLIIDTSPGISTLSINAVAVCDKLISMMRIVNGDTSGTLRFISTIQNSVKPATYIVLNQIPNKFASTDLDNHVESAIISRFDENVYYAGVIKYSQAIIDLEFESAFAEIDKIRYQRPFHIFDLKENSRSKLVKDLEQILGVILDA